jgi:hypothetical protein
MGYPDNNAFMVAGYTVTAVIVLAYWVSLLRRTAKLK